MEIELPFIAARRLLRAKQQDAASALATLLALKQLLGIMASAGIRVVPLKGHVLLERLFGDATIRPCQDIDLLIHPDEMEQAENVLRDLGYRSMVPEPSWTRDWIRRGVKVELHLRPHHRSYLDAPIDAIWRRVRQAEYQGQPIWLLAPADELISLCMHAARHRYNRLSMLFELATAFEVLGNHLNSDVPDEDKTESFSGILRLSHAMVESFAGTQVTAKSQHRHLRPEAVTQVLMLSQNLWQDILSEAPCERIEWELLRLLLLLEPTYMAKLRACYLHLPIILGSVTPRDNDLAASLGLCRYGAAFVVRPIRLIHGMTKLAVRRLQTVLCLLWDQGAQGEE